MLVNTYRPTMAYVILQYIVMCVVCRVFKTKHVLVDNRQVFTARRYASAVYAMVLCLSVRTSVCLSQVCVLSKQLNTASPKQYAR